MNSNRRLRLGLALLAAVLHLAVPVGAYAKAQTAGGLGDFCSATRGTAPAPVQGGMPSPLSMEHHCAHAPCCTGGAAGAVLPSPPAAALWGGGASPPRPEFGQIEFAQVSVIAAAQPRGPPLAG